MNTDLRDLGIVSRAMKMRKEGPVGWTVMWARFSDLKRSQSAQSNSALAGSDRESETTFPTTAQTNLHNTSTVDPVALNLSNGNKDIADAPAGEKIGRAHV